MTGDITGLAGVILWTAADRFEAMRSFYLDVLGLEARSDRAQFVSFAWGSEDPTAARLTISVHSGIEGRAREPFRTMLNLGVTDIDGVYARLLARGVTFVRRPEREHFGGRFATFEDPDGNLVQLLEQPSAGSPRRATG